MCASGLKASALTTFVRLHTLVDNTAKDRHYGGISACKDDQHSSRPRCAV